MFAIAIFCGLGARRRSVDPADRNLAASVVASLMVPVGCLATFDTLDFPMAAGVIFLMIGLAGGLWRLAREAEVGRSVPNGNEEVRASDGQPPEMRLNGSTPALT
jgi:hypothetical protein